MNELHSQTLVPTVLLVVKSIDRPHACWHGAVMWWMVLASSWNKVFKLPVGFHFLAVLECASDQSSQSRVGLLGLPRLAGGIPPVMGRPWGHRCWNLQRAQQPDLLSQVINNRGCIFTLFTKKASLPPPKYHHKLILQQPQSWYIFILGGGGGGGGGERSQNTHLLTHYLQFLYLAHLNNGTRFLQIIFYKKVPFSIFSFGGSANLRYSVHVYIYKYKYCSYIVISFYIFCGYLFMYCAP